MIGEINFHTMSWPNDLYFLESQKYLSVRYIKLASFRKADKATNC